MKWFFVITAEFALVAALGVQVSRPVLAAGNVSPVSPELAQLQSTYDNGLKKLSVDEAKAIANLQSQYTNALTSLEKKAQEAGKLEQVMLVRKERDRFNTEKTIGDKDISPDIPELGKLQNNYIKSLKEMPLGKAKDTIKLMQQFDKSLATLEQNLTKQGDTTSAIEVRNVRDSLSSRPEISEANSIIAGADASKPKEPEQAQPSPAKVARTAQPTNKVDNATSAAGNKKYTGKTMTYIKQRFMKLYEALLAGDSQGARALVDPAYLKKEGEGAVDKQLDFILGGVASLMKEPSNAKAKADAMRIKVDDKEETATLVPRFWSYGRWSEQPTMYWIQVDGDWYLDIYTDIKRGGNSRNISVGSWSTSRSR